MVRSLFAPLLPPNTSFATMPIRDAGTLFPSEAAAVAGALPKRYRSFATGRMCARLALGMDVPIEVGPGGAPRWPAGFIGSITHTDDDAAAVASPTLRSVGIDLESIAHAAAVCDLLGTVATPRDVIPEHASVAALVFSAKESVYKCLHPLGGLVLQFADVDLVFGDGMFEITRAKGYEVRGIRGRFALDDRHVATIAFIDRQAS